MVFDGNTARPLPLPEPDDSVDLREPLESPAPAPPPDPASLTAADWLISAILVLAVGTASAALAGTMPSFLLHSMDFWFEADTIREVSNMISRTDDHSRTSVHPLFSLLTFTPVFLIRQALALPPLQAALYVTGVIGGAWSATLYLLLRLLGCPRLDAGLFTLLGLSSASAFFWLPVPNSCTWGSWSIMIALTVLLLAEQRRVGASLYVAASALSLSITVTNWASGLLSTVARWPLKQAIQLSINAFCLVVLLWGAQKLFFPSAEFFIGSRKEANWINHPQSGQMHHIASSFAFHTVVAPAVRLMDDDGYIQYGDDSFRLSQRLAFQFSTPGSGGPLGLAAVGLWSALLLTGLWGLVTWNHHLRFRLVLTAMLLFELALHMVYGEETFTYSMNFLPLLLSLTALGTFGRRRPWVLAVAGLLILCGGINNWQQFRQSVAMASQFTPQREAMLDRMQKDPDRPWPRSVGHILLAVPGSPEAEHAYHEPGGDFSPQAPSFGVSLWLCDAEDRPVVTSQTLPMSKIQQTFEPSDQSPVPAIRTHTSYYDATWSRLDATHWELRLKHHSPYKPAILLRSVGPAGGPVTALSRDGDEVTINRRWVVRVTPSPTDISLGEENDAGGLTARSSAAAWSGDSGWGYARLTLAPTADTPDQEYRLLLTDLRIPIDMRRYYKPSSPSLQVEVPDPRFRASMEAQRFHLMMGLVGGETRPGDPTFFVRAWQREGSYITAALARVGDPNVGWVLSRFLAIHDFAGGAGPEADAPGLAIWALTTAAAYLGDTQHDRWLWPHIQRKASHIEAMRTATHPILEPFTVPSPYDLQHGQQARTAMLAQPSRDGVIVGRVGMDWPTQYVNAVSHHGLTAAADFAARLGKRREAARWRAEARALQESWMSHLSTIHPRTVLAPISRPLSLYPLAAYRPTLADSGPAATLAQAHRLLRSGRPDAVWSLLDHLWQQQASPGLYTWDRSRPATPDVADGWQYLRGWHRQDVVSPDYETAALLLLLQQDMLASVDDSAEDAPVVIGAGVPAAWLRHPLSVSGLALPGGSADWRWDGKTMTVTLHGPARKVALGAAFPPRTALTIIQTASVE